MLATMSRWPLTFAVVFGSIAALLTYFSPSLNLSDFRFLSLDALDIQIPSLDRLDLSAFLPASSPPKDVDWTTRKEDYPVQEYIPLPDPTRKTLPRIQHQFRPEAYSNRTTREQRLKDVQLAVLRCWKSYKRNAHPRDELRSISHGAHDIYGNWSLTLVESLDTLWAVGLKDEFKQAVEMVQAINFNSTTQQDGIDIYDITSGFLGGLISAYELSWNGKLKDKAIELATVLYAAFDTPSRIPNVNWNMTTTRLGAKQTEPSYATIGDVGGIALEFTRLAIITKDPKWYDSVARVMEALSPQLDYLAYSSLLAVDASLRDKDSKSADDIDMADVSVAFYDSLPKMYTLLRGSDLYKSLAKSTMDAIIKNLLFRPMIPPSTAFFPDDILLPGTIINNTLTPLVHHTSCSLAGTLAYTSRLLRDENYLTIAHQLLNGCLWASQTSPLGLMPETFTVVPCPRTSPNCTWDENLYNAALLREHSAPPSTEPKVLTWKHRLPQGLTSIPARHYTLHPSLISSIFTIYRITGDPSLQDTAWELWKVTYGRSKTKFAHGIIEDVTQPQPRKLDLMPSGWMGGTAKFFALMFAEVGEGNLERWVMSAAGHGLRVNRVDLV